MLSKNQILKARQAIEKMYSGSCTAIEHRKTKNEKTKLMEWQEVTMLEDQPCRLSYSSNFSADKGERASGKEQVIRVFLSPEVEVHPGYRITITQNGRTGVYAQSGQPAVYATHQEIILKLWEDWA